MRRLLTSFIVMFCVVSFTVGPVAATDPGLPNQINIVEPSVHTVVLMAIPQGQTREWTRKNIPNGNGGIMAICLDYLLGQRVYPAAAPTLGGNMICLADLLGGPFQWKAAVHTFTRLVPGKPIHHTICDDALILAEFATTTTEFTTHTISCDDPEHHTRIIATLNTEGLEHKFMAKGEGNVVLIPSD
jgi:hypothetical protein